MKSTAEQIESDSQAEKEMEKEQVEKILIHFCCKEHPTASLVEGKSLCFGCKQRK